MGRLASWVQRRWQRHRDLEIRVNALETAVGHLCAGRGYADSPDVGLNGQRARKKIFSDIGSTFRFDAVIETGTWMGDTTGYLATTMRAPVHSCELHVVPHAVAKMRLANLPDVHLARSDSREFLRELTTTLPGDRLCLFYLDAHWHSDLPLAEELRIISAHWRDYVIVVDDFRVPGDDGYRYDSYGRGKVLSVADFGDVFARHNLMPFFPAATSAEESGYKRGCVVLAPDGRIAAKLRQIESLVAHQ
jgi:hypothetical protein